MNTTATPNTEASTNALPLPSDATSDNPQSAIRPASIAFQTSIASAEEVAEEGNPQSDRIARLPKATRDMLNLMLDDGLPYHVILDELGETAQRLNAASLAKWVQSGYEEYLKERQTIEGVKTQAEFAADLLRALGDIDASVIHRACMAIANLQMFKAVRENGDQALRDMLLTNPSSYLNILNTLRKMIQPTIDLENHRIAIESGASAEKDRTPSEGTGPATV